MVGYNDGPKGSSRKNNANAHVWFDLGVFTSKLGDLLGADFAFKGPGPVEYIPRGVSMPDPAVFAIGYLGEEMFSKFDDQKASVEKQEACLSRFYEAEASCGETNARFIDKSFLFRDILNPEPSVAKAIWRAQRKIEWLLGEYDDSKVIDGFGFGPGASTRLARRHADLGYKLGGIPQATSAAVPFVRDILPNFPLWERELTREGAYAEVVVGNKIVGVPKNYKTDRMIAIEPDWNMFIQKGFGQYMRRKLRQVGVDLSNQEHNALAAGLGSLYDDLATIDLSMASDCVAYELVRFMLPPDWFDALEQCRSPSGVLPSGEILHFQKFSSMGNGYTFELETLIFWALCQSVVELVGLEDTRVLVYGDDIVVPSEVASLVCETLQACGFTPNVKKTFTSGPFRESCGSHYYEGHDITPFYIRESVDRLDRLFLLHNNVARYFERTLEVGFKTTPAEVADFLAWIRSHAPENWQKPRLPRLDIGDGAFYGCFELSNPTRLSHGLEGWRIKTLQSKIELGTPFRNGAPFHNTLLKGLYSLEHVEGDFPLCGVEFLSLAQRGLADFSDPVKEPEGKERAGRIDAVQNSDVKWFSSNQRVMSLATDYCWWELALLHPISDP